MKTGQIGGVVAMATLVVASNILVQLRFGDWLTWGAFTYPFAFLVNDVMNRRYGVEAARRTVWAGFGVGVICSLVGTQITGEAGPLVTTRIALGSGAAFLLAQLTDLMVFDRFRRARWWRAPLASSFVGATLDTFVFFSIAFAAQLSFLAPGTDVGWANEPVSLLGAGPSAPLWASLAAADWMVKMVLSLLALIPFRALTRKYRESAHFV